MTMAEDILPLGLSAALRRSPGARFRRVALQVNPYAYLVRHAKARAYPDEAAYNAAIVSSCLTHGIEAIAVADHFRIETSQALNGAARVAGITVFPAFEAVSKEGVHLLCLFDPDRPVNEIDRIIGHCGVHNRQEISPRSELDAEGILCKARNWDTVVVAAHITSQQGGLLRTLAGQSRVHLWQSPDLYAVAIPGAIDALSAADQDIIGSRGEYRREHPVAVLNAGDVCAPGDLGKPGSWSMVKMTSLTLDGLRQAVLDPGSRIRLASDPVPGRHSELVALSWQGGFFDGIGIRFSDNLNVLVGGRGTRKSTIVESIRYALGIEPLGEEARRLHEGIVRNVLKSGTKVSLLACTRQPGESWHLIERTVPNPPVVRDSGGDVLDVRPIDILPGTEIFGQREISELTKSPERLTRLLDRFVDQDSTQPSRKASIHRELDRTRRELAAAQEDLATIDERLAAMPGLENTLLRYRQAGVEERLREQSLLVREETLLTTAAERITAAREALDSFGRDLMVDRVFVSERAISELPSREILAELDAAFAAFNAVVAAAVATVRAQADTTERVIADVRARWSAHHAEITQRYEQILRDLQREHVDGEEFIRLRRRIEELRPLRERQQLLRRLVEESEQRRRNLLAEWEDLRAAEYQALRRAAKTVTKALESRVRVTVTFSGNRGPLADFIRKKMSGRFSETIEILTQLPDLSLRDLVTAARAGRAALVDRYGLPPGQAEKLASAPAGVLMELEELELPPTTQIELNIAADGQPAQWQPLDELSTGQKATAVLLLLLHESAAPLVVDQPEDDLDNRFITDGIVPLMRAEKQRRQFVFSTHNANIPVLGDAELILGLRAAGEGGDRGRAEIPAAQTGSIDSRPVREMVEEILEGGREAFETRRRKYGF